jgi:cyclase
VLKARVIGTVLVRSGITVQSIGFARYLPIGRPQIAVEYLNRWGIDEIVLLHIDAGRAGTAATPADIASCAAECHVPLSVGGGIVNVGQVHSAIHAGADKVVVNTALITAPDVLERAAVMYGSQAVVASIDARRQHDGRHLAFVAGGRVPTDMTVEELARRAESLGAGELFVTSIDRDGSKQGYDLDLVQKVAAAVRIPVIASGGVGHPRHFAEAFRAGAAAAAAGNFFHFTEHSAIVAKRALVAEAAPVRLDTYVTYERLPLGDNGRVARQADDVLDALRFEYIPEEVI